MCKIYERAVDSSAVLPHQLSQRLCQSKELFLFSVWCPVLSGTIISAKLNVQLHAQGTCVYDRTRVLSGTGTHDCNQRGKVTESQKIVLCKRVCLTKIWIDHQGVLFSQKTQDKNMRRCPIELRCLISKENNLQCSVFKQDICCDHEN